jgi:ABC-type transport system substrate-binding protein
MAIDLPTIAKDYYRGTVEPYPDTITSRYMKGWGFPYEEWPQDLKDEYAYNPTAAKKLLAEAGYPDGFKTNIVADSSKDMDLLQIVKSYFAEVGIDMEIRAMAPPAWIAFVDIARKHDQLILQQVGPLGHCSDPIRALNRFHTGSSTNYMMISDPVCDAFYAKVIAATSLNEVLLVLRDINEYVARQHFIISLFQVMTYSLYQPWLKGFNAQFGSTWGVATGPGMLSFYLGRFWIDDKLKTSMGH